MSQPDRHGEFSRTVTATTLDGKEARTISLTRTFDAAPEELWDAITDPERIPRWFLPVTGDPKRVGDHFQLEGNAGGEVLECERPRRLAVSWIFGGQTSRVEATLSQHDKATELRLDHTVPVDDHWREFGPGAVGIGWELALSTGLARYLAEATVIDYAEVDPGRERGSSPAQSPELSRLIAEASASWADADIVSGAQAAETRAAAARCHAVYTGQGQ